MRRSRLCSLMLAAILLGWCMAGAARAQDMTSSELLKRYMQARSAWLASRDAPGGARRLPVLPPERIDIEGDTLRAWLEALEHTRLIAILPDPVETFSVQSWEKISHLRRTAFQAAFDSTAWAFTGSNSRSPVDTMRTTDLRSRLQTVFGAPTVTLVESGDPEALRREQVIEFEYWFLLNDGVRVVVLDVNGPWDRGLVLAADQRYRSELPAIKAQLLEQLLPAADRSVYADYYYNVDQRAWYLTGFDGASFFDRRILRPDMSLGRPAPVTQPTADPSIDDPNEPQ